MKKTDTPDLPEKSFKTEASKKQSPPTEEELTGSSIGEGCLWGGVEKEIVFVCTGNTCRSPMAEGIAKSLSCSLGLELGQYKFLSRGLYAESGVSASENALLAMARAGIDISEFRSARISLRDIETAAIVLCMTASHKRLILELCGAAGKDGLMRKVFTLAEFSEYGFGVEGNAACPDILDPFGMSLDAYVSCAAEIKECIRRVLERLADDNKR